MQWLPTVQIHIKAQSPVISTQAGATAARLKNLAKGLKQSCDISVSLQLAFTQTSPTSLLLLEVPCLRRPISHCSMSCQQ